MVIYKGLIDFWFYEVFYHTNKHINKLSPADLFWHSFCFNKKFLAFYLLNFLEKDIWA